MEHIRGVVFDKDGTLVGFHETWDPAVADAIQDVCPVAADQVSLAAAIGYDLENSRVLDDSPFVAESAATLNQLVEPFADPKVFEDAVVNAGVRHAAPEPGAGELLAALVEAGMPMAIATNDSEESAQRQLAQLGWAQHFAGMFGYDSGFGPKPEAGMVEAAALLLGFPTRNVAMVGDSSTDVYSGQAAGAFVVYLAPDPFLADPAFVEAADLVVRSLAELRQLLV